MDKKAVLIGMCIPGIIIISIFSVVMIFNKPDLEVQKNNNKLQVQLGENYPVDINIKDIEKLQYLKGYLLMNKNYIQRNGEMVEVFNLYNGDKNVQLIAMNDKESGIYIETPKDNYLISTNNSKETYELYKKLESGANINIKYIGNM